MTFVVAYICCHSCLGLRPWSEMGLGRGEDFPQLTGVVSAVVAICLFTVSNSMMLMCLPQGNPRLQHWASWRRGLPHGEHFPQPSAPLCLSPASPAQTSKTGLQPAAAVGPQSLSDPLLADSRIAYTNTRLLCTFFNSIFLSGHFGISATHFYFHPKFSGLFTPSSHLLEPTRSQFWWLSQKGLFPALCGLAQSKAGLFP